MLVFAQAEDKVVDGTTTATVASLQGGPLGVTLVAGPGSTANFDSANVGTDKTVTLTGYSLGGANASAYALAVPCCGPAVSKTTADITAVVVVPPVVVPPVIPPVVVPPVVVPPVIPPVENPALPPVWTPPGPPALTHPEYVLTVVPPAPLPPSVITVATPPAPPVVVPVVPVVAPVEAPPQKYQAPVRQPKPERN